MNDPLATIRRAYRYIAAYERRVLDAIDVVDESLRSLGFERSTPHRWSPLYSAFPSRTYAPERSVWDNLPNYAMRYQWISGEPNSPGSRWVLVDHVADTAFERRRLDEAAEPDPLHDLGSPEEARSVLRWHVVEFRDAIASKAYTAPWNKLLEAQVGSKVTDWHTLDSGAKPSVRDAYPLTHTIDCVDIAALTTAESLRELFVQPLVDVLRAPREEKRDGA